MRRDKYQRSIETTNECRELLYKGVDKTKPKNKRKQKK